jgi:uncharacterized protein (TIGR02444 family)
MAPGQRAEYVAAGDAFWRFSLAFYARPGVADALLALQDRAGRDVNLILFGLWLAVSRQHRLDAAGLAAAKAAAAAINAAAVAPLRRLRRRLKGTADRDLAILRRRIAGLELQAERRVQYRLAERVSGTAGSGHEDDRLAMAAANLSVCLGEDAGSAEAGALRRALAALTRAQLPQG